MAPLSSTADPPGRVVTQSVFAIREDKGPSLDAIAALSTDCKPRVEQRGPKALRLGRAPTIEAAPLPRRDVYHVLPSAGFVDLLPDAPASSSATANPKVSPRPPSPPPESCNRRPGIVCARRASALAPAGGACLKPFGAPAGFRIPPLVGVRNPARRRNPVPWQPAPAAAVSQMQLACQHLRDAPRLHPHGSTSHFSQSAGDPASGRVRWPDRLQR